MEVLGFGGVLFNLTRTFATHHEKNFVPVFFKVSITLSLEKKLCLEKTLEKVMNFASKNCTNLVVGKADREMLRENRVELGKREY